jgi:hypothetical protein
MSRPRPFGIKIEDLCPYLIAMLCRFQPQCQFGTQPDRLACRRLQALGETGFTDDREVNPEKAEQWRQSAARHDGSWWEDWAAWADARAGRLTAPPPMGGERYPALGAAPGGYVRGCPPCAWQTKHPLDKRTGC